MLYVGILMLSAIKNLDFEGDIADVVGGFLAVVMMPFAYSIATGIMFGVLSWVILKVITGKIKDVTLENCHFIEDNPSLISGAENVTLKNCSLEYKKGSTHEYYYGKMDLQPNHPQLLKAPFNIGDTLYTDKVKNFKNI
jgi:hypothetical protein